MTFLLSKQGLSINFMTSLNDCSIHTTISGAMQYTQVHHQPLFLLWCVLVECRLIVHTPLGLATGLAGSQNETLVQLSLDF